jgi:FkbM family methyltransferase
MNIKRLASRVLIKTGSLFISAGNLLGKKTKVTSLLLKVDGDRELHKLNEGQVMWLKNETSYLIDNCLINTGTWEPQAVNILKKYLKPGDVFIDVGANTGFFSIIASKITGDAGYVYAFEPTRYYFDILLKNMKENNINNCFPFNLGLSDNDKIEKINIFDSTATLHMQADDVSEAAEEIKLRTLDSMLPELGLTKIDFIKVDIDGHEPFFLNGALKAIEKFDPLILLEVNHLSYMSAGINVIDFYNKLKFLGFNIYDEFQIKEINSLEQFLKTAGNFNLSSNILLSKKKLNENSSGI